MARHTGYDHSAESVTAWRDAAVADGWTIRATYETESVDTAATLERAGWKASLLLRPAGHQGSTRPITALHVWAPDGADVSPVPVPYNLMQLLAMLRTCPECGAQDVATFRVGFANRACAECRPALLHTFDSR